MTDRRAEFNGESIEVGKVNWIETGEIISVPGFDSGGGRVSSTSSDSTTSSSSASSDTERQSHLQQAQIPRDKLIFDKLRYRVTSTDTDIGLFT